MKKLLLGLLLLMPSVAHADGVTFVDHVYRNTVYGFSLPLKRTDGICWQGATDHDLNFVVGSHRCKSKKYGHVIVFAVYQPVGRESSEQLAELFCRRGRYMLSTVHVGLDDALRCKAVEPNNTTRYVVLKKTQLNSKTVGIAFNILLRRGTSSVSELYLDSVFSHLKMIPIK